VFFRAGSFSSKDSETRSSLLQIIENIAFQFDEPVASSRPISPDIRKCQFEFVAAASRFLIWRYGI
jgi:hypothetical protein